MPSLNGLLTALVVGLLALGLVGLVREIRGVVPDPTRPPTWPQRLAAALRSPAVATRVGGAVLTAVTALVLTRWPVAAVALGLLVLLWPKMFGGARQEQAQIAKIEALVVFTESLRDTIAAHASLEQAIPAAAGNAPPLLREPLVRLIGQLQARVPMDKALLSLAAELQDKSADLVIAALILNVRRRGDRLGEVLTGLTVAAREELEMRRKVSSGRVELRRGVQIIVVLTLAMAVFLAVFGRTYTAVYGTPSGQVVLAVVAGFFAAGFGWLRKLSSTAPVAPFLARPGQPVDPRETDLVIALTGSQPVELVKDRGRS